MTIQFYIDVGYEVQADGDGEITITTTGGYHGEDVDRGFTVDELQEIYAKALQHKVAYQAYKDADYDESVYYIVMGEE